MRKRVMTATIDRRILTAFEQVFHNKGLEPPPQTAETVLDGTLGLESMDFAEVVLRLEQAFGKDPFAEGIPPNLRTLCDLAELYREV
jgi:acyl carrier protein